MSKLTCSLVIKDQITDEVLFKGSFKQLLDMIFDNTFFEVNQKISCDCYNFNFKF